MKGSVLIVEDDKQMQQRFKKALEEANYVVDTASTLLEAFEKARCRTYHVASIDIMLTDNPMDRGGIEVLRYLNSLKEGTRAVVVSQSGDVRVPVEVMNQGTYAYVIKRDLHTPADLVAKIDTEFSKCKLRLFGEFDTFTAYLSGAGNTPYYESELLNILKTGAETMYQFLNIVFSGVFPALRQKGTMPGLNIDKKSNTIYGLLWSKGLGHAVWVSAGKLESNLIEPNVDGASEIAIDKTKGPWKWKIWKVIAKRDDFQETLYDK